MAIRMLQGSVEVGPSNGSTKQPSRRWTFSGCCIGPATVYDSHLRAVGNFGLSALLEFGGQERVSVYLWNWLVLRNAGVGMLKAKESF